MDISNWSMAQIMELPDHLFGRRYMVGCAVYGESMGDAFDISMFGLPERAVIWELRVRLVVLSARMVTLRMALGDQLPANEAEFNALPQLFSDIGYREDGVRVIRVSNLSSMIVTQLRYGIETAGRRLVIAGAFDALADHWLFVDLVVSSIPRSLPEWFG